MTVTAQIQSLIDNDPVLHQIDLLINKANPDPIMSGILAQLVLANVMATSVNNQVDKLQSTNAKIKANNDLLNLVRSVISTANKTKDTDPVALGTDRATVIAMLTALEAQGISTGRLPPPATGIPADVTLGAINSWRDQLTTNTDSLSTGSQQDQATVQSFVNVYTKSYEVVTALETKRTGMLSNVDANLRP
jgi:hypothetical protein